MENKSPFNTGSAEYEEPIENEDDESYESGVSKKKSRVSELWKKLFGREEDRPKEEHKGFFQSFGTLFGKLIGIDKEEGLSTTDQDNQSRINLIRGFHLPIMSTEIVGNEGSTSTNEEGESVQNVLDDSLIDTDSSPTEQTNSSESPGAQEETIDEEAKQERAELSSTLDEPSSFEGFEEEAISDRQAYEPRILSESAEDNTINQDDAISGRSQYEQLDNQPPEISPLDASNPENTTKTITQRNNRLNTMGEQREQYTDRYQTTKLKKETKKLRKRINELQIGQKQQDKDSQKLRERLDDQQSEIFAMGRRELYHSKSVVDNKREGNNNSKESQGSNALIAKSDRHIVYDYNEKRGSYEEQAREEIFTKRSNHRTEGTAEKVSTIISQSNHLDKMRRGSQPDSIDYSEIKSPELGSSRFLAGSEKRFEALDTSDSDKKIQGINLSPADSRGAPLPLWRSTNERPLQQQIEQLSQRQAKSEAVTQEYKKAIRQGVSAGIIVLVSFGLVVLFWGLIN